MNHIKIADALGELLDSRFKVAGIRFGLDPLLNILPVGGSTIGLIFASYILWIAYREQVPAATMRRMVLHVIADFVIGLIPFIGWIGDFLIRANIKNLKLLHKHVENRPLEGKIIAQSPQVVAG